ncbi:hypothetical protein PRZ48_012359 [Zasmidium cellare]|uniref:F-box domain-containing protein n=1 Tax=Zasmidium cellare TaxID=395010 RepID=A0ABR0E4X1_ZASCE|nr:hypothetical protein PRZ48_012359 [Zasmidium cellare]
MTTNTTSNEEKPRLDTLPDEVLLRIAGNLIWTSDFANLRQTCRKLRGPSTEAYIKTFPSNTRSNPQQEIVQATRYVVESMITKYGFSSAWKARSVSTMVLQLPSSRKENRAFLEARDEIKVFEATSPSPVQIAFHMPSMERNLERCKQDLQRIRNQQSESIPLRSLLALFPKVTTLKLEHFEPLSPYVRTSWADIRRAVAQDITSLTLTDCQLSSGHLRLFLRTQPRLQRLTIYACDIIDDWTSVLVHILLHAKTQDVLENLFLSRDTLRQRGPSFLPEGVMSWRDRELQTRFKTRESSFLQANLVQANGILAVRRALEYVLRLWMGGEERVGEVVVEAMGESEREGAWDK